MFPLKIERYELGWLAIALLLGVYIVSPGTTITAIVVVAMVALASLLTPLAPLAIMLVLSPLRTLIATEASVSLPADIGQVAFFAFLVSWLMGRIFSKQPIIPDRLYHFQLPILGFVVVTGLTVFAAQSVGVWLTEWLKWVIILVLISVCVPLFKQRRWEWVAALLCLSAAANAVVGLYIFFGGSGADHLLINGQFFRAFGTFGQPNPFGGFLGILLPISTMLVVGYGARLVNAYRQGRQVVPRDGMLVGFYALLSALMLAGIVASWSRGAWLSVIVSFAAVMFALPRRLLHSLILVGVAGSLVGIIWFSGILPQSIVDRLVSSAADYFVFDDMRGVDITTANYAVVERLAHWQAALNMAQQHFWLGVGFGNYEAAYAQHRLLNWDQPLGHAHNYYLNILAEAGIMGAFSFFAMWGAITWLTWRIRRHPDIIARSVAVGLLGSWAYIAAHSLIDNLYVNNVFLHIGVLLAIATTLHCQLATMRWRIHDTGNRNKKC